MPIEGIEQPEILPIDENLRLRKLSEPFHFSLEWYQDPETLRLADGPNALPYDEEKLKRMYRYLDAHGEAYFIEAKSGGRFLPVGDVTFWQEDMPIVIGDKTFRGKGVGKAVIKALIERGRQLGYPELFVNEIYSYNLASQRLFEGAGFSRYEETELGWRYRLRLK